MADQAFAFVTEIFDHAEYDILTWWEWKLWEKCNVNTGNGDPPSLKPRVLLPCTVYTIPADVQAPGLAMESAIKVMPELVLIIPSLTREPNFSLNRAIFTNGERVLLYAHSHW